MYLRKDDIIKVIEYYDNKDYKNALESLSETVLPDLMNAIKDGSEINENELPVALILLIAGLYRKQATRKDRNNAIIIYKWLADKHKDLISINLLVGEYFTDPRRKDPLTEKGAVKNARYFKNCADKGNKYAQKRMTDYFIRLGINRKEINPYMEVVDSDSPREGARKNKQAIINWLREKTWTNPRFISGCIISILAITLAIVGLNVYSKHQKLIANYNKAIQCYYGTNLSMANYDDAVTYFSQVDDKKNAEAYYYLGNIEFDRGNIDKAKENYLLAKESGNQLADLKLLMWETDLSTIYGEVERLVGEGCVEANVVMGEMYLQGIYVNRDFQTAQVFLEKVGDKCDADWLAHCLTLQCRMYSGEEPGARFETERLETYANHLLELKAYSKTGCEAICKVAASLWTANYEDKAGEFFRLAAEHGYDRALLTYAEKLTEQSGENIPKDEMAFDLLKELYNKNDYDALCRLGQMYFAGVGTNRDYMESIEAYLKATELSPSTNAIVSLTNHFKEENLTEYLVDSLKLLSDEGDASAKAALGYCYQHGIGVDPNDKEARALYLRAIDMGSMAGKSNLASYDIKKGNYKNAMDAWKEFASARNKEALRMVGKVYLNNKWNDESFHDEEYGMALLTNAFFLGDADSAYDIATYYTHKQDYAQRLFWNLKAATLGNPPSMFSLGLMYISGDEIEQNLSNAFYWYQKASDSGHAGATNNLGVMYENGEYVDEDQQKAFECYKLAANLGDEVAMANLGSRYLYGIYGQGTETNETLALEWFQKGANKNDGKSMYFLGVMYEKGLCVDVDLSTAISWYEKAAAARYSSAMTQLGLIYLNGNDVIDVDYDKAYEWYLKAAEAGDSVGMKCLAEMYLHGTGINMEVNKAIEWYQKAFDNGYVYCGYLIGQIYEEGIKNGEEYALLPDSEKSFYWYKLSAEAGNDSSMEKTANAYQNGTGVEKDDSLAVYWYEKAYEAGYITASFDLANEYKSGGKNLESDPERALYWHKKGYEDGFTFKAYYIGMAYKEGSGTNQDPMLAYEWFMLGAEAGDASSMVEVGQAYRYGNGIALNEEMAFEWYQKAAEKASAVGCFYVAWCYQHGFGTKQDYKKAYEYYKKGADLGDASSMNNIGFMYDNGLYVRKNSKTAFEWYQKAADHGDAVAMYNLSLCYKNGSGVKKNQELADEWYQKAVEHGYAEG